MPNKITEKLSALAEKKNLSLQELLVKGKENIDLADEILALPENFVEICELEVILHNAAVV